MFQILISFHKSEDPFVLILVYNDEGYVVEMVQARDTNADVISELEDRGYHQLPTFRLTKEEYRSSIEELVDSGIELIEE